MSITEQYSEQAHHAFFVFCQEHPEWIFQEQVSGETVGGLVQKYVRRFLVKE